MVRISLLPPELEAERQARRRRRYFFLGSVVVLGIFAAAYLAVAGATLYSRVELGRLEAERKALEAEAARYQEYARIQAGIKRLEELLRRAMERPPDWQQALTATGQYIPEGIWLTDFKAEWERKEKKAKGGEEKEKQAPAGPVPGDLTLRGWGVSHGQVASWLRTLEEVPQIEDVRCQFLTEGEFEGVPAVEFELKATVVPGPGYRLVSQTGGAG